MGVFSRVSIGVALTLLANFFLPPAECREPGSGFIPKDQKILLFIGQDRDSIGDSFRMWKDKGWGDSRIEANPFVKDAWLREISS